MQQRQGRFMAAAALATVLALSGVSAYADGAGGEPLPAPLGVSTVLDYLFDAASALVDFVY